MVANETIVKLFFGKLRVVSDDLILIVVAKLEVGFVEQLIVIDVPKELKVIVKSTKSLSARKGNENG